MSDKKQLREERCVVIRNNGFGEKQVGIFTGRDAEQIKQVLEIPIHEEGEINAVKDKGKVGDTRL